MQTLATTSNIASAAAFGTVRDAGKVNSRIIGMLLERELLEHFAQQQTGAKQAREFLAKIGEWFTSSSILRLGKSSLNLLVEQWIGSIGATNEAAADTEEIYVSLGISYYVTRDWEIVRELDCVGISVDVFDDFLAYSNVPPPEDMDHSKFKQDTHRELSSIFEDLLEASSRQNLTAAICLTSLVLEKKDHGPTPRFVSPANAVRGITSYIDHANDLLGLPMTAREVPGYAADWTLDFGSPSGILKQFFDKSAFLKSDARLSEFEQTILAIGEFPDVESSKISLCLFDLKPSRSSIQDRSFEILDRYSLRFKPVLDHLETVDSLPFTVLSPEDGPLHAPRLLEPPKHLGRGFRLDDSNSDSSAIELPSLGSTVHGIPTTTLSILLTRWINHVRAQGLTTQILHTLPGTQTVVSANAPQPTAMTPFVPTSSSSAATADQHLMLHPHQPTDIVIYESIACMPHYLGWSFEELRLADYNVGVRRADAVPTARLLQANPLEGTAAVPYAAFEESFRNPVELPGAQGVGAVPYYRQYSYEELRVADYAQGRRWVVGN
ncbi:MAG: hypothetical protein Q9165_005259 [Trypethelium subeluteriae]